MTATKNPPHEDELREQKELRKRVEKLLDEAIADRETRMGNPPPSTTALAVDDPDLRRAHFQSRKDAMRKVLFDGLRELGLCRQSQSQQ